MELLLSIALLSIMVGGTLWLLFLQNATYAQTTARAEAMARLASAYQVMYKELRPLRRTSLEGNVTETAGTWTIATDAMLFKHVRDEASIKWLANDRVLIQGVLATFTALDQAMNPIGTGNLASPSLLRIELQSTEANDCSLNFLVAPRSN